MAFAEIIGRLYTSPTLLLSTVFTVLLTAFVLHSIINRKIPSNSPPFVSDDYPVTGAFGFWTERWSWVQRRQRQSPTGNFTFHAGPNTIVSLSGDKGRQLFFDSKDLGFAEGYAVLFGQAPKVQHHDDRANQDTDLNNHFNRRLTYLLKNEQFRRKLPVLLSDTREAMETIKNNPSGTTNPFESIYRIVFRLTIRMVAADEIADDSKVLNETLRMFEMIDSSAGAASVMFPKFPSPAVLKRTYGGARLYMIVENIIKKRAASDVKHEDALQYLLDQGDRTFKIVEFIVGALFAGLLNSGINAAWVMCFLATSPEWLGKALEEVRTTASKYARDTNAPLREQLNDVPLEAWEAEFPIIDLCLRESIRLNLTGAAFRRNTSGRAIPTGNGDEVIPPDAFVTYATGDINLDPEVYHDPTKWDPARYLPDRAEDKKKPYSFIGWGVGRHPCLGMRFAKLEQNIITAYFIASFEFSLQDKSGKTLTEAPPVDFDALAACKPKIPQILKVTSREKCSLAA